MKIAVKKRYVCPVSEVFEMGGDDVLLAGSPVDIYGGAGGGAGENPGHGEPAEEAPFFYTPVMSSKDYFLTDEDADW